jgi:hypothetical protein
MSDSIGKTSLQNARTIFGNQTDLSVEGHSQQLETPLQKLRRLQAEAAQLSEELTLLTTVQCSFIFGHCVVC